MKINKIDHNVKKLLKDFTKNPDFILEQGGKHAKLRNIKTNAWIIVPGSLSDTAHGLKNFQNELKKLKNNTFVVK